MKQLLLILPFLLVTESKIYYLNIKNSLVGGNAVLLFTKINYFKKVLIVFILLFIPYSALSETIHYEYDEAGRVIKSDYGNNHYISYTYDKNGNLVKKEIVNGEPSNQLPVFVYAGSWTNANHGNDGWYIGDFDGDGKDDIMRYVPGKSGGQVFLSDGNQFY